VVIRVVLDVNVWVSHYLALSRGRQGSAAQMLVRSAFAGHCRLAPLQPVISHAMLDTLQEVLLRLDLPGQIVEAARNAVEACATEGIVGQAPHLVLGGGVLPMKDAEDGGVLDTAIAGSSDFLVTNNVIDFTPGKKSLIDAEIIRYDTDNKPDVLKLENNRLPNGLVIASTFAAKAWLIDGLALPPGILERFAPRVPATAPADSTFCR